MKNVVLALYRGMLRASQDLSVELTRAPPSLLQACAKPPVALEKVLPGLTQEQLTASGANLSNVVRQAFRRHVDSAEPTKQNALIDDAFNMYRWMNEWQTTLSGLVYQPYSDNTVNGVRVQVQSRLESAIIQEGDRPSYFFSYHIKITNVMPRDKGHPVQLLQRQWEITAADGTREEIEGPGVVGRNPVLNPGESFQYSSGTRLGTRFGTMRGQYEFFRHNSNTAVHDKESEFNVAIGPFGLGSVEELQESAGKKMAA